MAAGAGNLVQEFSDETTCPVCLEYFTDPVITDCGHNFCKACITQCWEEPDRNFFCPECREPLEQCNVRPNRKLASIVEISKKFSQCRLQEADGTGGVKGVCKRHQEPLKLFCRDDEAPICVVCDRSKEHKEHCVIPVDEAAVEYKKQIQAQLPSLEEERMKLTKLKVSEQQRIKECLNQLEKTMQEIPSHFKEIHKFLEGKERFQLSELANLKEEVKKNQEENMTKLSNEISHFSDMIKDVEAKCRLPDSEFLQDIRGTLRRCLEGQKRQQLELSPGLEWRLRSCSPNIAVLRKAMEELEGSMTQRLCKVNVTLDPDTGNPKLAVSEDLKSVCYGISKQDLLDNPERFDLEPCVLGCERFTSGRHYWEVEVMFRIRFNFRTLFIENKGWLLGVAQESLSRKGNIISPKNKIWAMGRNSNHQPLWAFSKDRRVALTLKHEPKKIWVFLDYEEGRVEFFDAYTEDLIFAFPPDSFSGEGVRPFFWVGDGVHLRC